MRRISLTRDAPTHQQAPRYLLKQCWFSLLCAGGVGFYFKFCEVCWVLLAVWSGCDHLLPIATLFAPLFALQLRAVSRNMLTSSNSVPKINRPTAIQCRYFKFSETATEGVGYRCQTQVKTRCVIWIWRSALAVDWFDWPSGWQDNVEDDLLLARTSNRELKYNGHPLQETLAGGGVKSPTCRSGSS